jgi:hypothetical protein
LLLYEPPARGDSGAALAGRSVLLPVGARPPLGIAPGAPACVSGPIPGKPFLATDAESGANANNFSLNYGKNMTNMPVRRILLGWLDTTARVSPRIAQKDIKSLKVLEMRWTPMAW